MSDDKMSRFRVSVPKDATQVIDWVKNQSNLSYAFLCVIRAWIAQHGTGNVFAQPIGASKRGRPSNALKTAVEKISDDAINDDVIEEKKEPPAADAKPVSKVLENEDTDDDSDFFDFEQRKPTNDNSSMSIIDMMNGR